MFQSLKNKIREETGNDLKQLTAKITSATVQKIENLRGHSHQGSTSSLNSLVSSDGLREDGPIEPEEFRKRLGKIEAEYAKKLEQKEHKWREIVQGKDRKLSNVEREKEEALKQVSTLRDALRNAEDLKQKILEHQENSEQLEGLQSQELSKIKQLILQKEKELSDKNLALKEATSQLEKMRSEINRLRRQEEKLSDIQDDLEALRHSTARDLAQLATDLAKSEQERKHLEDLVVILRQNCSSESPADDKTVLEKRLLEQRLEEAHMQLTDIKTSWSDKIASLETQVGRLSRQAAEEGAERRRAVEERDKLNDQLKQLEAEIEYNKIELNTKEIKIKRLTEDIKDLSSELKILQSENEEEVAYLRTELENSKTEVKVVQKNLENVESELDRTEEENSKLKISVDSEHLTSNSLRQMITKLEKELAEEKANSLNVQKTLSRVTSEKNTALLRNAEISQKLEIIKQDMRRQEKEATDISSKLNMLEEENAKLKENRLTEQKLSNSIIDLEDQVADRNKTIKMLQLRLADMKKTLQQELKSPVGSAAFENSSPAILTPSQISTRHFPSQVKKDDEDVNFKYLKHVVIKFLTSREYEAQHLIKAISTVLRLTSEEERLIQETLEWKQSWFGSKPKLHKKSVSFAS